MEGAIVSVPDGPERQRIWRRDIIGNRARVDAIYMVGAWVSTYAQEGQHVCAYRISHDLRWATRHLERAVRN